MPGERDAHPARVVLDASALLAYLQQERGHQVVEPVLGAAAISAVNLSEVLQKSAAAGVPTAGLETDLQAVGVRVQAFDAEDAACAASLWTSTRKLGLSLGDRACLALAQRLHLPAYTADRAWAAVAEPGIVVRLVR
ncbi:MAG TPA: type II toxin-antitoxin system VapC family toxin [Polyangia bacterium]